MSEFGKTDRIDIINTALTVMGQQTITAAEFTSPTRKESRVVKDIFRMARNSLLREHDWNFARTITSLVAAPATVIIPGWEYIYYYPSYDNLPTETNQPQGSIFINKVFTDTESQEPDELDFKIFNFVDPNNSINGKFVATQYDDCYAEYTNYGFDDDADVTYAGAKAEDYDITFAKVLALYIASMTSKKITGNQSLAKDMDLKYQQSLNKAKLQNHMENKTTDKNADSTSYADSRG